MLAGGLAGVAAILTVVQLLWMFGMFSPADALGGRCRRRQAVSAAAYAVFRI